MRYEIEIAVKAAEGFQIWAVEADTPDEAIRQFRDHGGEFVEQEVSVTQLDFDDAEVLTD